MAAVEKISISKLGGDNWSIWKAKFQALLEYKGLFVAIEEPETEDVLSIRKSPYTQQFGILSDSPPDKIWDAYPNRPTMYTPFQWQLEANAREEIKGRVHFDHPALN
jgi:hypothetical protein